MRKNKILPAGAHARVSLISQANLARPYPVQRIMVVDDDPFFCHRNAEVLIRRGYDVNAAEDAEAGWEELQVNRYHLLITEFELPKLTGLELVKKMRSAHMALPVIVATEKLPVASAARHLHLHPVVTLLKPYTIMELLDAVKVVLGVTNDAGEEITPPNGQGYPAADGLRL